MTKNDIVEKIHSKMGFSKSESSILLESMLEILKSTLESGEKIKVSGFGNFDIKQKKDRIGRNPHTGEAITIKSRRVMTFKPSNRLKQSINMK